MSMDPQKVHLQEARCIQEQPPFCVAACPIHVDVRGMMERIRKSDFRGGLSLFARSTPFPRILAALCDHPCETECRRSEAGDPLRISALERACVDYGAAVPKRRRARLLDQRVAVVGAGLSGLTAAVELATKGYEVTVFDREPVLLSRIRGLLPNDAIEADLAELPALGVEFRPSTTIDNLHDLARDFDAVYAAPGASPLWPAGTDETTLATTIPGVFAGGSARRSGSYSVVTSIQDGQSAAISTDRYLQGASLTAAREPAGPFTTRLYMNTAGIAALPAVQPSTPSARYSQEEAAHEADRCFPCGCLECVKVCEYLSHYKSYPRRYIREIYNNDCIVLGNRPSNRMINSCSLCGLCAEVCPEKLNMGEVCLDARQSMVERGKMPASAHEFALRDLEFSTSDAFSLVRHQPGHNSSSYAFLPGCQLSASSPDHVFQAYQHLCQSLPGGVGLILGCCGAPARWAGRQDLFGSVLGSLRAAWTGLGEPRLITACSSCYRTLADDAPDLPVQSLWGVLEQQPPRQQDHPPAPLAIHDPCSTRGVQAVEGTVRRLLAGLGVELEELNAPGQSTCCGYGGLALFANPKLIEDTVARRVAVSPRDYITYCAMCRDSFARQGKRALHVLDLMFEGGSADPAARPDPGFSGRRENRARLKTRFLRELWRESVPDEPPVLPLSIAPDVAALLERRFILLEDVRLVIAHAERTGEKFENASNGHVLASYRPATVTFWVEYSVHDDRLIVHNAYSHRMQVAPR